MIKFTTKTEYAYALLRDAIICGDLKPGERLILSKLAERYQISESPVREAIKRLEAENLVTSTPHVGAIVTEMAPDDIVENLLIRAALEGFATYLAVEKISEEIIDELRRLVEEMGDCVRSGDFGRYPKLNRAFHHRIIKVAGYPKLTQMIENLWDSMERFQAVFNLIPGRVQESYREHQDIFRAIEDRKAEKAEAYTRLQKMKLVALVKEFFHQQNGVQGRDVAL